MQIWNVFDGDIHEGFNMFLDVNPEFVHGMQAIITCLESLPGEPIWAYASGYQLNLMFSPIDSEPALSIFWNAPHYTIRAKTNRPIKSIHLPGYGRYRSTNLVEASNCVVELLHIIKSG